MPLESSKEMTLQAQRGRYAVPAFNAENLEMIQAIIQAAEELNSPVMIQTTPKTVTYMGLEEAYAMVHTIACRSHVPVALHLDHSETFDDVMRGIKAGYTSVMIDASKEALDVNIEITKSIVRVARPMGIAVEAELGRLGGKEDNLEVKNAAYTDVKEAERFAKETSVDLFAIAIGTAHGFYKGEPHIDFDRIKQIREVTDIPLVLHGGTGIPDDKIRESIRLGMCKVNFATELRAHATKAVRKVLANEQIFDPKAYMGEARKAVKQICMEKIQVCGSANRVSSQK